MPDPTQPTDTPAATVADPQPVTPPAQVAAPAKTFTQEEVDQIVKSRLERGQRKPEPQPPKAEVKPADPAAAPSLDDIDRRIERHGQFVRAVTTAGLDDAQSRILGDLMRASNPTDVAAWCGDTIAALKLGKQLAPPAVQPAAIPAAPAIDAPKPAAAPSAPTAHALPTANGVVDIFSMTPQQHQQTLGPQGIRKALEELWRIGNQMSGAPERPKAPR